MPEVIDGMAAFMYGLEGLFRVVDAFQRRREQKLQEHHDG